MASLLLKTTLLAAVALAVSAVPAVDVTLQLDNTAEQIQKQQSEIYQALANLVRSSAELLQVCKVPLAQIKGPFNVKDESYLLDSKTTATYYCTAADLNAAATALGNCRGVKVSTVKDKLKDTTSIFRGGEIKVEKLTCGSVKNV